jgi:sensor histidine kinase YesM
MKKIDWPDKRRNYLQVLAFAFFVATLQYAFMPGHAYGPPLVYSFFIASITWAIIDLGRDFFPSSAETGWPRGGLGLLLVAVAIVVGYLLGSAIADRLCSVFGWQAVNSSTRDTMLRSSILITGLAGLAGSYYFYSKGRNSYLERKMGEVSRQADEARLRLLESQLEPHMLFNTLANLRALIATDPPRATAMLDRMIAYLRATLAASRATSHTLQAEFERLQDYLELMAIRMGPRLQYTLDLPAELAPQPLPALLLQPLVENCIQHGLEPKVAGGSITVRARRSGAQLTLEVSDTGLGCSPDDTPAGSGFGLAQVRERLLTTYGAQATLALSTPPGGGTTVTLSFPAA